MATLRWGAATDTGLVRTANEDAFVVKEPVFAVADGMGGHLAGEVASEMAVAALKRRLSVDATLTDVATIVDAVRTANLEINDAASASPDRRGMGTTLTVLAVVGSNGGERLALVNVGDSRAYVLRDGRLQQLSIDHSYVQELITSGQLDADEARSHPHRNIVTRALGIDRTVQIDAWTLPLVTADRFLLCSDGLVDEVLDETIAELLASIDDPQRAAEQLVATANRHGGRDNTTVVVVDVVAGGIAPDEELDIALEPHWADGEGEVERWADETPTGAIAVTATSPSAGAPTAVTAGATATATTQMPVSDITGPLRRPSAGAAVTTTLPDPSAEAMEPQRRRRRLTIPMILFVTAVLGVFVVAFVMTAAYARSGYFLGFAGDDVAVFKGRPDSLLWFNPTVEARLPLTRDDIPPNRVSAIERNPTFDSLDAAVVYVDVVAPSTTVAVTTTTVASATTVPVSTTAPSTPEASGP
jgi:PPM family protein phosphatase